MRSGGVVVLGVRVFLACALLISLAFFYETYFAGSAAAEEEERWRVVSETRLVFRQHAAPAPGVPEAIEAVRRYLDARAGGDARTACRQLTPSQARTTAYLLSGGSDRVTAADCPRYILRTSDASLVTRPALEEMQRDGFWLEPNGFAFEATARGSDEGPDLTLLKEDGRYLIDAQAHQRVIWLRGDCLELNWPSDKCGCMYDHARHATLRRDGNRGPARLWQTDLQRALRACS